MRIIFIIGCKIGFIYMFWYLVTLRLGNLYIDLENISLNMECMIKKYFMRYILGLGESLFNLISYFKMIF